jgi:hypothetical protein
MKNEKDYLFALEQERNNFFFVNVITLCYRSVARTRLLLNTFLQLVEI